MLFGYEIPLLLALLSPAVLAGSWRILEIATFFQNKPLLLLVNVIGFFIALIALQAKLERVPFDIPHAETEIVGGQFTEYSGKKLAFFRLLGDIEMVVGAGLIAAVFMGGFPGGLLPGLAWFVVKTLRRHLPAGRHARRHLAHPHRPDDQFFLALAGPAGRAAAFYRHHHQGNGIMSIKIVPFLPELLRSLFKKPVTVKYPFEKDPVPRDFRGNVVFDAPKCIGCMICVNDCPAEAIDIIRISETEKKFKMILHNDRCIHCAQCVDSCPTKTYHMDGGIRTGRPGPPPAEDRIQVNRPSLPENPHLRPLPRGRFCLFPAPRIFRAACSPSSGGQKDFCPGHRHGAGKATTAWASPWPGRWPKNYRRGPDIRVVSGGEAPENFTGAIRAFAPSHVILLDAVDHGLAPGTAFLADEQSIAVGDMTSHHLPLKLLMRFLGSLHSLPGHPDRRAAADVAAGEQAFGAGKKNAARTGGISGRNAAVRVEKMKGADYWATRPKVMLTVK